MADSIKFTIGGQLGPSYRGALAQAEAEAIKVNRRMATEIQAQQKRIAALPLAAGPLLPGQTEVQFGKRMAMEKELQLMTLKYNLTAVQAARRMERERVVAAEAAAAKIIAARESETLATITGIAAGRGAGLGGGIGHGGISGIIRESLVLVHEGLRGNFSRMAGSVTLLAQYMGLLGKVVKSTAAEQVIAANAATKLSQAMAAEAFAAKGTAEFATLSAAALKQEEVAIKAVTEAEIALQTASVSLNPLAWVLIAGAVIIATLAGIALHFHKIAKEAKNLHGLLDGLNKRFTDQADALRENSKAHQEYLDFLKKVGDETDSLPEKINRVIEKLREQAQAEIELARLKGASATAIEAMEEAQLQRELEIVSVGKLQAQRQQEQAEMDLGAAETARQAFDPSNLLLAQQKAKHAGEILDAVQAAKEQTPFIMESKQTGVIPAPGFPAAFTTSQRPPNDADKFTVTAAGKTVSTSLADAKAAYDRLTKDADRLEQIQKQLQDTYANDKLTVEERTRAVRQLTDEQSKLQDELGIKQTTGREIAELSERRRGRINESEMEKAGIFAGAPAARLHNVLLDQLRVQREQLRVQRDIAAQRAGKPAESVRY